MVFLDTSGPHKSGSTRNVLGRCATKVTRSARLVRRAVLPRWDWVVQIMTPATTGATTTRRMRHDPKMNPELVNQFGWRSDRAKHPEAPRPYTYAHCTLRRRLASCLGRSQAGPIDTCHDLQGTVWS
jgi:hypothetical protein